MNLGLPDINMVVVNKSFRYSNVWLYSHLYRPYEFRIVLLKSGKNDNLRGISCITDTYPLPGIADRFTPGPGSPVARMRHPIITHHTPHHCDHK